MNKRARDGVNEGAGTLGQLAALETLSTGELRAKWRELYGKEPPRFYRQLLIRRLAYRIQELAFGGLTQQDRARMDSVLDEQGFNETGVRLGGGKAGSVNRPIPGTRLVREWQGQRHEVTVLEDAFEYRGKPYRSLTAVARAITGTAWNGLLFFGLRRPAKAKGGAHGAE